MTAIEVEVALALFAVAAATGYFVFASFVYGAGYQPTPRASVAMMLRLAEVTPHDTVYDLGAGTGAIVFRAARTFRARVVGVEVEPIRMLVLRLRRRFGTGADRITLHWGNLFHLDYRTATVVTAFLWPGAMARLRPKFESELPVGARVVSHCHAIPGWTPTTYDRATDVYLYRWTGHRAPPEDGVTAGGT